MTPGFMQTKPSLTNLERQKPLYPSHVLQPQLCSGLPALPTTQREGFAQPKFRAGQHILKMSRICRAAEAGGGEGTMAAEN